MAREQLFPPIEPYDSGRLAVDTLHSLYWEVSGNPEGAPVAFLHGGPGAGAIPAHRRFFDPEHYRIVIFDQRGAGRSTPAGETRDNTTQHLIEDMERIRAMLDIDAWLLFGGSWGSTLALAYAQTHPERALGLILRGVFLGSEAEIRWFLYGIRNVFPEAWDGLTEILDEAEKADILAAYCRRLSSRDPAILLPAARAWSRYEGACSTLLPSPETVAAFGEDSMAVGTRPHRGPLFRQQRVSRSPARCSPASSASAISPGSSSRAATTWSAPSSRRTRSAAPGRKRTMSWCPIPAIPRWTPASGPLWSARPSDSRRSCGAGHEKAGWR